MKLPKFKKPNTKIKNLKSIPFLTSLILLLILTPLIYLSLRSPTQTAAWLDDTFRFRTPIIIGNTGSADADKKVKLDIDTATFISNGKMQSDCGDSRFTDATGKLLDYYSSTTGYDIIQTHETTTINSTSAGTNVTATHTVSTRANQILVVIAHGMSTQVGTDPFTFSSITFNGNSLTSQASVQQYTINRDYTTAIFTLVSPTAGSYTLSATTSNGINNWVIQAYNVTGVDTSSPIGATGTNSNTATSSLDVSITTTANNSYIIGGAQERNDGGGRITMSTGTTLYQVETGSGNAYEDAGGGLQSGGTAGAKTVTFSTGASTNNLNAAVIELKPATYDACNNASTDYYVTIPTINAGNTYIYHYYGNSTVGNGAQLTQLPQSTFSPTSGPTAGSEEQSPGPVAAWKFDEGTGTTANDAISGNTGTLTNGPQWKNESECISGKCLYFDGSNDYVVAADSVVFDITQAGFTYSAWIKGTSFTLQTYSMIMGQYLPYFGLRNDSKLFFSLLASGSQQTLAGTTVLNPNTWYFVTATYDSNGYMRVYLNGKQDAVGGPYLTPGNSASDVYVGKWSSANSDYFPGFIDEPRIYPYARTAAQIKSDFAARGSTQGVSAQIGDNSVSTGDTLSNGLVAYYPMDESAANSCTGGVNDSCDRSGNGNDGAWANAVSASAGKYGSGTNYSSGSDRIDIPDSNSLDLGTNSFTISTWLRPTNYTYPATFFPISKNQSAYVDGQIGWGSDTYSSTGIRINFNDGTNKVVNDLTFDTGSQPPDLLNKWSHLTLVFDRTAGKVYAHINGVRQQASIDISSVTGSISNSSDMIIGTSAGWFINGSLDETRIYNRALSPAEVRALYNWAPSPIAHYKLDENTGTTSVADSSGSNYTGTMNGSMLASNWVPGKFGSALKFDNSDDNISVGDITQLNSASAFSFSAWVKDPDKTNQDRIFHKSIDANNDISIAPYYQGEVRFYIELGNGANSYAFWNGYSAIADNTWYHAQVVYDGTQTGNANRLKLYINGIQQTLNFDGTTIPATTANLAGAAATLSHATNTFDGALDDVLIYNYARTSGQVVEDMNGGHPLGGSPVGSQLLYLKLDEGYGTVANDTALNNDDGELLDGPTWTNSGKYNKGLTLDGLNDRIQTFTSNTFEYTGGDLSMSIWFKPDASDTDQGLIISKPWNGGGDYNYRFYLNSNETVTFYLEGATAYATTTTQTITNGSWNHLAATVEGATKAMKIYINGKLVKSDTHTITSWTPSGGDAELSPLIGCLYPYGSGWAGESNYCIKGDIDEPKIYNGLLTPDQILIDYNQGKAAAFGSTSTASNGITADNSSSREYCVPGDTSTCNAPLTHWKLDENTGTSANDTSGNGNTGTLTDGPTWAQGKFGSAVNFDGNDDYITVPYGNNLDFGDQDFSISTWFTRSDLSTTGSLISKWAVGGGNRSYVIQYHGGNDNIYLIYSTTGSNELTVGLATPDGAISQTNRWYHLTFIHDAANNQVKLALDGQIVDTETLSGGFYNSTAPYKIGSGSGSSWAGIIDDTRIYNYARTPAQIAWEYNRGAPVAWYRMDECQGTTINDASGRGNNGTITIGASGGNTSAGTCAGSSGQAWKDGATGKINSSLEFDGTDDYVTLPASSAFDVQRLTIAAWTYSTNYAANMFIFEKTTNGSVNTQYSCFFETPTGIVFRTYNSVGTIDSLSIGLSSTGVVNSQWNHIACIYDGATKKIYVNGRQIATAAYTETLQTNPAGTSFIGVYGGGGYPFNGKIDDVRIYNYALTPAQIRDVYTGGTASFR